MTDGSDLKRLEEAVLAEIRRLASAVLDASHADDLTRAYAASLELLAMIEKARSSDAKEG